MMHNRLTPGSPLSRLLALTVLAVALFLLWEGLAQPVIDLATDGGPLGRARHANEDLSRIAERLPGLVTEKAALAGSRPPASAGFLPGTDPQLAAAAFAGRLNTEVRSLHGDLISSEAVDAKDEDGVKRVGLRVRVSLPQINLPALLYRLEYGQPAWFVQTLSITADKEERLAIALDLIGYLGGESEDAVSADIGIPANASPDLSARPLFTSSRHLATVRMAALASASLRVTGLVVEQGRTIALVNPDGGREVKVGPGSTLNGWRVTGIDGRGIDLVKDGRRLRVLLKQPLPPAD